MYKFEWTLKLKWAIIPRLQNDPNSAFPKFPNKRIVNAAFNIVLQFYITTWLNCKNSELTSHWNSLAKPVLHSGLVIKGKQMLITQQPSFLMGPSLQILLVPRSVAYQELLPGNKTPSNVYSATHSDYFSHSSLLNKWQSTKYPFHTWGIVNLWIASLV